MSWAFCPLYSGSTGNCTFAATERTRILIDAGVSASRINEALSLIGASLSGIDGVLITHEHIDHIRSVGVLARKGLKIFANEETWQAMELSGKLGNIPDRCRVSYPAGHGFMLGEVEVVPLPTSHDAASPSGYMLCCERKRISVVTDTGYLPNPVLDATLGSDILMLESNHDPGMLEANPRYSPQLKRRILGTKGHLSNDTAAEALVRYADSGVRYAALAHLSQENNTPELAFDTAASALLSHGVKLGSDIKLTMTWPDRVSELLGV